MVDFTKYYKKYKGMWIALNPPLDKVLGKGGTAKDAYKEAVERGEANPTLFRVPDKNIAYVG